MHNKERKMNALLSTIANKLQEKDYRELLPPDIQLKTHNSLFLAPFLSDLEKDGFVIMIYRDNMLKYWSDNSVQIQNVLPLDYLNKRIHDFGQGYYVIKFKKLERETIVGLIHIKNKYPYENNFLKNKFNPDFNLPHSVEISLSESNQNNIRDRKGHFLFSLMPTLTSITEKPYFISSVICYTLGILFFLLFFDRFFVYRKTKKHYIFWMLAAGGGLLLLRYLMIEFKIPSNFYKLILFGPSKLAISPFWNASLGDFVLNILFLMVFAHIFHIPLEPSAGGKKPGNLKNILFLFLSIIIVIVFFLFIEALFSDLLIDSTITFTVYKVLEMEIYTLIAYLAIAMLMTTFILTADKFIHACSKIVNYKVYIAVVVFSLSITFLYIYLTGYTIKFYSILFFILLLAIISVVRFTKYTYSYYMMVLIIFVLSIYSVAFITDVTQQKERDVSKTVVVNLIHENDPIAEHLLSLNEDKINNDKRLARYMISPTFGKPDENLIRKYIQEKYFHKDWRNYTLKVTLCGNTQGYNDANQLDNCIGYFNEKYKNKISPVMQTKNYYFVEGLHGSITYFGYHEFATVDSSKVSRLYIELNSKLTTKELGYPELLLDEKMDRQTTLKGYSYAKYKKHKLVSRSGEFPYSLTSKFFNTKKDKLYFVTFDGYIHLINNITNENSIVLSKPRLRFIDILILFSYIFLFYNLILALGLLAENLPTLFKHFRFDYKKKILLAMISILLISFVLIGGGTIYYDIKKLHKKHNETIGEKIQSVEAQLSQKVSNLRHLSPNWKPKEYEHLDNLLIKYSLVFFTDIYIYDTQGELLGTSRPEIVERGLVGNKMNTEAYGALSVKRKTKFIHDEQIGTLVYSSAYVPLTNKNNKVLGYLNLPYFTKPSFFKEELTTLIVTIVNLYVVLFLISIVIAVFLSNKITQPLRWLQNKFKEMELGKVNEQIHYFGNDEIGGLIKEYNRMVIELEKSIRLLKKSERESAWREMAKQIAHEIKNPLTPMKLSIQFLQRSWKTFTDKEDGEKFKRRLDGVSRTLIDQIDSLSAIAAEFSNFAKMPKANNEVIDIVKIITDNVRLFENTENVEVILEPHKYNSVKVFADKEQLARVFINLIKNAIQSIPDDKYDGYVYVQLFANEDIVRVKIEDNGAGIPSEIRTKLFMPSFTTKSSGTGMGLAIVKSIIENANGTIWFETEVNKGTRFFVELPRDDAHELNNSIIERNE